jgi:nanoRNase/pAp phosphatase (c-di-AMP/oligoRNAs hydrolase)
MQAFSSFVERVRDLPRLVIQAHDFPDHDAISSSFALAHLLGCLGVRTRMVYNGLIDRVSLRNLIDHLDIDIVPWREAGLSAQDHIVTVDGCIGEKNLMDLPGREIAVIDHHQVAPPQGLWFQDVRPDYGACATILVEYYAALGIAMPRAVATALQVGLAIDTANLTRGFQQADVAAFATLHRLADQAQINRICRNSLLHAEMVHYQHLLQALRMHGRVGLVWLERDCPKNLLGMMGDFLMTVDEIETTILAAPVGDVVQLSLRTENPQLNVGRLVREVLTEHGLGFGGGHAHMAGGMIERGKLRGSDAGVQLLERFVRKLSPPHAA